MPVMSVTDLLIIYLALGAPIAVYKYLQNRTESRSSRVAASALTFIFWIPAAVRIARLYFANANLTDAFASPSASDPAYKRLCKTRDALGTEIIRTAGSALAFHDVRDTIERYAGLADAVATGASRDLTSQAFLSASGRDRFHEFGLICFTRRNRRRLERHHVQARRDFIALVDRASDLEGSGAVVLGLDLAQQLNDKQAVEQLIALDVNKGEVWKPESKDQSHVPTPTLTVAMTPSLNND